MKSMTKTEAAEVLVRQARSEDLPDTVRKYRKILRAMAVLGLDGDSALALARAMELVDHGNKPAIVEDLIDPRDLPWQIDRKVYPFGPGSC